MYSPVQSIYSERLLHSILIFKEIIPFLLVFGILIKANERTFYRKKSNYKNFKLKYNNTIMLVQLVECTQSTEIPTIDACKLYKNVMKVNG